MEFGAGDGPAPRRPCKGYDMRHTITDIKILRSDPGRVKIYLDHQFAFTVKLIDAAGLEKDREMDAALIRVLRDRHDRYTAYRRAIRYISRRPRSRREVERYLSAGGADRRTVADTLARLSDENYLDDDAFACFWLDSRQRHRPLAKAALRHELRQKGIGEDILDRRLAAFDDGELACRAIEGRMKRWRNLDESKLKGAMLAYLQRRGFSLETALAACAHGRRLLQREIRQ
jgi:regulatory protein